MSEDKTPKDSGIDRFAAPSADVPRVDGYEIGEPLGEGGMGTVWRALQLNTGRVVALKLLGIGAFGSPKLRARFEREVELTARLEHPNIARIYDSGIRQGVYCYAMELIEGEALDEYAKAHWLTQRQVLELMQTVCEAVQHAHQRGVIHRDLKPSNILVTGDGQPHVLDFGLAKTVLRDDTHATITVDGQIAGTPLFMSPEQAAGQQDQLDTRTDVYSLGVILFRILTGQYTHDPSGAWHEVARRICEQEIKRPRQICEAIDRELEALLLKALARDPKDRYGTAGELANDIQNYLSGDLLAARPPTTLYFLCKRVRKHRLKVAVAGIVLAGIAGTALISHIRITRERDRAEQVARFLKDMLSGVGPSVALGRDTTMLREILDKTAERVGKNLKKQPEVQAELFNTIGRVYDELAESEKAEAMYRAALALRRDPVTLNNLGMVLNDRGKPEEAEPLFREALATGRDSASTFNGLANVRISQGKPAEAEAFERQSLDILRKLGNESREELAKSLTVLGTILMGQTKLPEAESTFREALTMQRELFGPDHPNVAESLSLLASVLMVQGKLADSESAEREALALQRKLFGNNHPAVASSMTVLAITLQREHKLTEAEDTGQEAVAILRRTLEPGHLALAVGLAQLVGILNEQSKFADAESLARESLAIWEKKLPEDPRTFYARTQLGASLLGQQKYQEAEPLLLAAHAGMTHRSNSIPRDGAGHLKPVIQSLVDLYEATGRDAEAAQWRSLLPAPSP